MQPVPCSCPISQSDWDDLVDGVKDSVVGSNGTTYYRQYNVSYTFEAGYESCEECSNSGSAIMVADVKISPCDWQSGSDTFTDIECDSGVTLTSSNATLDLNQGSLPDCFWRLSFSASGYDTAMPFMTGGISGPSSDSYSGSGPENGDYPETVCGGTGGGRLADYVQKITNISVSVV